MNYVAENLQQMFPVADTRGVKGVDIAEICGGVGRTSKVAMRRHYDVGSNFDLVTGCDLTEAANQKLTLAYFRDRHVLVGPFGPFRISIGTSIPKPCGMPMPLPGQSPDSVGR